MIKAITIYTNKGTPIEKKFDKVMGMATGRNLVDDLFFDFCDGYINIEVPDEIPLKVSEEGSVLEIGEIIY